MFAVVITVATVTFICTFLSILTYYKSSPWRRELRRLKRILLAFNVFTFLACAAVLTILFGQSKFLCNFQGACIQLFGGGAMLYEAVLAIETAMYIGEACNNASVCNQKVEFCKQTYEHRLMLYHAVIILFGVCGIAFALSHKLYERQHAGFCYLDADQGSLSIMLFGELPFLLSALVITILNFYSWVNIVKVLKNLMPTSGDENAVLIYDNGRGYSHHTQKRKGESWFRAYFALQDEVAAYLKAANRLDSVTHRALFRLLFTPIIYMVLVFIPALLMKFAGCTGAQMMTVAFCSVIAAGSLNFLTWVLIDFAALKELLSWELPHRGDDGSSVSHPRSDYDYADSFHNALGLLDDEEDMECDDINPISTNLIQD